MSSQGSRVRSQHDLGHPRGNPRDLHAGGLRVPRGRPHAHEERRPHRGEERSHPRDRLDRLLLRRLRHGVRRRRQQVRRRLRASSRRSTSCSRSARRRSRGSARSRRRRATSSRSRSQPFRWRSSGAPWPSARSSGCTSPSGPCFTLIYSLVSHWIWSPDGWLFSRGHAGLRRLDGRPLPGRARRSRRCDPARAAARQVRRPTGSRTRSPVTTWRSRRSA